MHLCCRASASDISMKFELVRRRECDRLGQQQSVARKWEGCRSTIIRATARRMCGGNFYGEVTGSAAVAQVVLKLRPTGPSLSRARWISSWVGSPTKRTRGSAPSSAPCACVSLPRPCDIASQSGIAVVAAYRIVSCPRFRRRGGPSSICLSNCAFLDSKQPCAPALRSKRSGVTLARLARPCDSTGARLQSRACPSRSGLGRTVPRTHLA
jgi:hypothetical protein